MRGRFSPDSAAANEPRTWTRGRQYGIARFSIRWTSGDLKISHDRRPSLVVHRGLMRMRPGAGYAVSAAAHIAFESLVHKCSSARQICRVCARRFRELHSHGRTRVGSIAFRLAATWGVGAGCSSKQPAAVRKRDAVRVRCRRPVLCASAPTVDHHDCARCQIGLAPSATVKSVDPTGLEPPIHHFAIGTSHVYEDPRVGIGPFHLGHGARDSDWLVCIEFSGEPMVCRHRRRCETQDRQRRHTAFAS